MSFFATVFNQPSGSIQTFPDKTDVIINDFAIDEDFLVKVLGDLDVTKATGPDNIPARVFKHTSNAVAKSLKTLFYKIKQAGIYPDARKEAVVAPVLKKDSKIEVKNYRQISLLPIASKVLERCIFVALYDHFWHHLHPWQYGFRKEDLVYPAPGVYRRCLFKLESSPQR